MVLVTVVASSRDEATTHALEVETVVDGEQRPHDDASDDAAPSLTATAVASSSAGPSKHLPGASRAPTSLLSAGKSVAELREVAKDFPKDPEVVVAIVRAHEASGAPMTKESFADVQRALELEPKLATNTDILRALEAAATVKTAKDGKDASKQMTDGALQILSTTAGEPGFDVLVSIAGGSSPARQRAIELTKDPKVQANASKPSLILVKLRDASPCGRAPLLAEAATDADVRALPLLTPMMAKKGCGFLSLSDCYTCMGTRSELTKAINDINKRKTP